MEDIVATANRAVQFDQQGQKEAASYFYREASRLLEALCSQDDQSDEARQWLSQAVKYKERAGHLDIQRLCDQEQNSRKEKPVHEVENQKLQRCQFIFIQALDADEADQSALAVKLYMQAVELSLETRNEISDAEIQGKLTSLAKQALDRAEEIKGINKTTKDQLVVSPIKDITVRSNPTMVQEDVSVALDLGNKLKVTGAATYTEEEKRVLLATSCINNIEYVPFMSVDLKERFQYAMPFTDRNGPLSLSPKQKRDFSRWARPEEFCSDPKMIVGHQVNCFAIKQTVVSDCSFVASLAVSAMYEKKFGKRLITTIIYPCNKAKEPIYNPFGKYMVKLNLNGVPRKVIIDDYLPIGKRGELLCSYSTKRNELWISLLEKAYMKVMGGYDFPGSNSNIDLHALTGWIPERIAIRQPDLDKDLFLNLWTRFHKGDVLITVATGEMSDLEAERSGLVSAHAYAVLDLRNYQGTKLVQLKNPWSHVRWRGNYSELDVVHWTPDLRKALDYDPNSAAMFDNGVFWIDFESIIKFFDVFYLNWNPKIFSHTFCIHQSWEAGLGPIKDIYNMGDNPQFSLEADCTSGAIWILLTRHITLLDDFRENKEYITVLVYKNSGKKVYYPNDPPPYIDGIRINSPHYLCKIKMDSNSPKKYTLVVSQYEKMHTIHYTLRAFATCPFKLTKIINPYKYSKKITNGEWKGTTAGGCRNHPATYPNNPCYKLVLDNCFEDNTVLLDLKGPKQYQLGLEIIPKSLNDPEKTAPFVTRSSGAYRSGFVVLELDKLPGGTYHIIPSTYLPQQEGPFFLIAKASCQFQLELETL